MRKLLTLFTCSLWAASLAAAFTLNSGDSFTASGTNGTNLSATAKFSLNAGVLTVELANTGTDVLVPADLLTAILWNSSNTLLNPVSALLGPGSIVHFGADGGGDVGGEWAYAAGLAGCPGGCNQGISSSGFGLFGAANFGGSDLNGNTAVDGMGYGITSGVDNVTTGNAAVTGGNALIQNKVIFTLSNAGSSLAISDVSFRYGTALTEPSIACVDCSQTHAPEPSFLLTLPLIGAAMLWNRRRQRRTES
jgi:hypothetical protein